MADSAPKSYSSDPTLFLYTSLTSGSSHIVTATSRLETILKANRIPFRALDIATDEKARMLWGRRSGKDETGRVRKIPGLVQMGLVIGDLVEIEEWNEYGELKQHVTIVKDPNAPSPIVKSVAPAPSSTQKAPAVLQENKKPEVVSTPESSKPSELEKKSADSAPNPMSLALRQLGEEAAQKAKDIKKKGPVETFAGVGKAESPKEKEAAEPLKEKVISKPGPISLHSLKDDHIIDSFSSLQSPNSTAWRAAPKISGPTTPIRNTHSIAALSSLQSPNSTAWKPTDINPPVLVHRGSSIAQASAEEIKKVEDEATIKEEDEEDEESSDSSSEEESSSEEDEEKAVKPAQKETETKKDVDEDSSESSDDSDGDEVDVKAPIKQTPQAEADDSSDLSDSSEEESEAGAKKPITKTQKPKGKDAAKVGKQVDEEDTSDESESSEEEPDAKVPAKVVQT